MGAVGKACASQSEAIAPVSGYGEDPLSQCLKVRSDVGHVLLRYCWAMMCGSGPLAHLPADAELLAKEPEDTGQHLCRRIRRIEGKPMTVGCQQLMKSVKDE